MKELPPSDFGSGAFKKGLLYIQNRCTIVSFSHLLDKFWRIFGFKTQRGLQIKLINQVIRPRLKSIYTTSELLCKKNQFVVDSLCLDMILFLRIMN